MVEKKWNREHRFFHDAQLKLIERKDATTGQHAEQGGQLGYSARRNNDYWWITLRRYGTKAQIVIMTENFRTAEGAQSCSIFMAARTNNGRKKRPDRSRPRERNLAH